MGMIGVGGMGVANMDSFLGIEEVVVKAVCDVTENKMRTVKARVDAFYGNRDCEMVRDYRTLCARSDIDAVMIATPDYSHAPIGIFAARQGKDIYGETPFTHTYDEGLALAEAVTRNGCVWQTGNGQRVEPRFRKAVAAVRGGVIGRVAHVEIGLPGGGRGPECRSVGNGIPDFHWRWVRACGGGPLADGIGRYGDTALWGAGRRDEPLSVEGQGDYPQNGCYDTATAFRFRCVYSDGMELIVADGGRLEKGIGVRWVGHDGAWVWVTNWALEASSSDLLTTVQALTLEPCVGLHRDFIACVKTRQATRAPAASARLAAALGQAGDRAMRGC